MQKLLNERVYCRYCNVKTKHEILHTEFYQSEYNEEFQWHDNYHIVQCAGCETKAFVRQYGDEDTWDFIDGDMVRVDVFTIYPEEPKEESEDERLKRLHATRHMIEARRFNHVPEKLQNLYQQTVNSYNLKHNILCAAGLRTIIEGICNELGVKKGHIYNEDKTKKLDKNKEIYTDNLAGKIFGLFEKQHIIFSHALILQRIKAIGNDAVHNIVEPDTKTLAKTINIIESVLDNVYDLKKHDLLKK